MGHHPALLMGALVPEAEPGVQPQELCRAGLALAPPVMRGQVASVGISVLCFFNGASMERPRFC